MQPNEQHKENLLRSLSAYSKIEKEYKRKQNSALIGALTEELISSIIEEQLCCNKISTGAIINLDSPIPNLKSFLTPKKGHPKTQEQNYLFQIDKIIFNPSQCVPVFRIGDFVVVNSKDCKGIIEIKKSAKEEGFYKRLALIAKEHFNGDGEKIIGIILVSKSTESKILKLEMKYSNIKIFRLFKQTKNEFTPRDKDFESFFFNLKKMLNNNCSNIDKCHE